MKLLLALGLVLSSSPALAGTTLNCRAVDTGESGLIDFQYDVLNDFGHGSYNDLDSGFAVTLSRASDSVSLNPIRLRVNEKNISVVLDTVRKVAVAYEENESNPSEPLQTQFKCR